MNTDASRPLPEGMPHIACILLWYPLFTQPFIFREVENLKQRLPVEIYTLYASNLRYCSAEMRAAAGNVRTAGMRRLPCFCFDVLRGFLTQPALLWRLLKRSLFRRWHNFETFAENLWAFCAGVSLGRLLREDGIDMLYAPWPRGTATAAWVAANIAGIPFATAARGDNLEPADPDLGAKFEAALFIRANNAADQARIEAFDHGQAKNKVALIYNSLTLPSPVAARQTRRRCPVRLLALGRFDVTKGFDVLLAACDVLQRNGLNFHLTLAGGGGKVMGLGGMEARLVTMRKNLGLESRVEMPGLISHDDLPGILRNHDIFVAPCVVHASGRRDGIPNTVIEALAYGLPVISTTVNALPEVVRDRETGLLVPPGDPEALAGAVFRLAQNPDEALRMGRNGMLLVAEMFDPERNSRRLAELFVSQHALWKKSCAA
ncbi:glycosyltransferase family 4 protein [Candidatus Desulfovibrio trichonymphae]|uniref:Group 1 glycosyl transferase n=1 Tax=Candidatus Desulfovibrio trichonymphae TaxID=1725232 RepID=A0A1J1DZ21_9BACT|nr:glycosyltransferase family 4 protein [Candidatus Desulfovibrio trichonymphae]BAV92382.1 group 1 glycosyl transferase [Candidatus Desulfovibrio trichonymphae]